MSCALATLTTLHMPIPPLEGKRGLVHKGWATRRDFTKGMVIRGRLLGRWWAIRRRLLGRGWAIRRRLLGRGWAIWRSILGRGWAIRGCYKVGWVIKRRLLGRGWVIRRRL